MSRRFELVAPLLPDAEELREDIAAMLESKWLSNNGAFVRRLEGRIAEATGFHHAVTTANGTLGLMVAIRALGWRGEVILPSFTFAATAHAVSWAGCTPVLADIDKATFTLDPGSVARLLGKNTAGILPVDIFGVPAPLAELADVAGSVPILSDSAHAFGVEITEPDLARAHVYSLHATKTAVAGEGGAVATDDPELAERARRLANFGFDGAADSDAIGLNAKMPELSAILAFHQLKRLDAMLSGQRRWDAAYRECLSDVEGLAFQKLPQGGNRQFVPILIDPAAFGRSRDEVRSGLAEHSIVSRPYFQPPVHRLSCYAGKLRCDDLSRTEELASRILCLPVHPGEPVAKAREIAGLVRSLRAPSR